MARRVLIVDDHESFRRFARRLLEAAGYSVVGEAADGAEAISRAQELSPDIVLLDVLLPDTTGFDVAEQFAKSGSAWDVVLTSSRSASDYGERLERAPARGFISKGDLSPEALEAVLA
ncbi:MAG: response regulator [Gaiellaceae bacterium]